MRSSFVLARSPLRISLVGGGSDLLSYAGRFGGDSINVAIDRFVRVAVQRDAGGRVRSDQPDGYSEWSTSAEVDDPLVRAALLRFQAGDAAGMRIGTFSDAPPRTGLGGSAAYLNALACALHPALIDDPAHLARETSDIEIVDLARPVGRNDHYTSAHGGLCRVVTGTDESSRADPLPITEKLRRYVEDRLLLFYTGLQRDAGAVLDDQDVGVRDGQGDVLDSLHGIKGLVDELSKALEVDDVDAIGPLLHRHWELKQRLSTRITTPAITEMYRVAVENGAEGCKVVGAGSGGFLVVGCAAGTQDAVRGALRAIGAREMHFGLHAAGTELCGPAPVHEGDQR